MVTDFSDACSQQMSGYEGTYIDRLPVELQDKIGVPPVVGQLARLPLDVLDMIYRQIQRVAAATRIQAVARGVRYGNWNNPFRVTGRSVRDRYTADARRTARVNSRIERDFRGTRLLSLPSEILQDIFRGAKVSGDLTLLPYMQRRTVYGPTPAPAFTGF